MVGSVSLRGEGKTGHFVASEVLPTRFANIPNNSGFICTNEDSMLNVENLRFAQILVSRRHAASSAKKAEVEATSGSRALRPQTRPRRLSLR